jgi:hypothetical protein
LLPYVYLTLCLSLCFSLSVFLAGKGGIAARKLSVEQTRSKNTLFGAYLDSGEAGHVVGLQVLMEALGLLLSPLTVTYTQLTLLLSKNKKALYQRAQSCLLEQNGDPEMIRQNRLRSSFGSGGGGEFADFLPCTEMTLWPYRAILALSDEASPVATVLSYLDYNNYNWFMTHVVTRIAPYINSNLWYFRIIQQTPYYYFRYYFGDGASKLPVYRNACILREGLRVAKLEAQDIRGKIEAKRQQVEAEGGKVDSKVDASGKISHVSGSSGGILSSFQRGSSADDGEGGLGLDFGPDGSWQALNDTCLTRHEGQYLYKVCAFRDVFQDRVKLGEFSHWGDQPLAHRQSPPQVKESKMMSFKNRIQNKQKQQMKVASDYLTNLVSGSANEEASSQAPTYTKQFYGDGTPCHNGIVRHAVVEFNCAAFAEIVDVVEYEVSVST